MKAYALISETFLRKSSLRLVHLGWFLAYAPMFLIPSLPETWQWGCLVFASSGCLLPLVLSAGIFGDDIASGRIRMVATEPIRLSELYIYRFLGLSLQAAAHLLAVALLILLLHRLTGRGSLDRFAAWLLASWLIFNTWAALSTSVSVVARRDHNSMVLILATIIVFFSLYMLLLFFQDSTVTQVYHAMVRYGCPPVEVLVGLGLGKYGLASGIASVAHGFALTALYAAAGIVLLKNQEFKYAAD
jgi:ABC-type transport system involved in multi-copper enzyme maturation permease subunit